MTRHSATFKVLAIAALALSAASAASTDDAPGYARNGQTLTGKFPTLGITIEAGATVTFAGVYAEKGVSGTGKAKRTEFRRLIHDCEAGKIDVVLPQKR